jgi:hypothetical protein
MKATSMYWTEQEMIAKAYHLDPNDPEIRQFWVNSRPREEQIKFLDEYLAGENFEDQQSLEGLRDRLAYFKAISGISPTAAWCENLPGRRSNCMCIMSCIRQLSILGSTSPMICSSDALIQSPCCCWQGIFPLIPN